MYKSITWSAIIIVALSQLATTAETIALSPEKVVELARKQSIAVKSSEYNLKAQSQTKKSAFTGFLPSVSASATAMHVIDKTQFELGGGGDNSPQLTPQQEPYRPIIEALLSGFSNMSIETPDNLYNVGFTVIQPLFTGGRINNSYHRAEFTLSAQKWTHERMLKEIGLSALQLYWLYVNSLKQLEALKETR